MNGLCLAALAFSSRVEDRPAGFLGGIEAFRGLNLGVTETDLETRIEASGIHADRRVDRWGNVTYWLLGEDGENLNVLFRPDGRCRGIQRLQPIPGEGASEVPALPCR